MIMIIMLVVWYGMVWYASVESGGSIQMTSDCWCTHSLLETYTQKYTHIHTLAGNVGDRQNAHWHIRPVSAFETSLYTVCVAGL